MNSNNGSNKPSGVVIVMGLFGALAAIGGIAAAASSSKKPALRGGLRSVRTIKKPCGCGR